MKPLAQWWQTKKLSSADPDVRLRAVEKLSSKEGDEAIELLAQALQDLDPQVRVSAALALVSSEDCHAVIQFVEQVLHAPGFVWDAEVVEALAATPDDRLIAPLVEALDDENVHVRQAAAGALAKIGWLAIDDTVRAQVFILHGCWDETAELGVAAVGPLTNALYEATDQAKRCATEALGDVGTIEAFEALMGVLEDQDSDDAARSIAAWGLRSYCWEWITDSQLATVAIVLQDWSEVTKLGAAAIGPLTKALLDGAVDGRVSAARALGVTPSKKSFSALVLALTDPTQDVQVREMAACSLGEIGNADVAPALMAALSDQAWPVRVAAAGAMERLGLVPGAGRGRALYVAAMKRWDEAVSMGSDAVAPLLGLLGFAAVNEAAAEAVARIKPHGVDALAAVLRERTRDLVIREVAAIALAKQGDPRALEALRAMLEDPDMVIAVAAVWMLERLNWQPQNAAQRAIVAIARSDWEDLEGLGGVALEPLLRLAAIPSPPPELPGTLHRILKVFPHQASEDQLREIVSMEDPIAAVDDEELQSGISDRESAPTIPWEEIKQLAKTELRGRGFSC